MMLKRLLVPALSVATLFIAMQSAFADAPMLYVRNKLYAKPLFEERATLYAVADDIFPMVQLNMRTQGRVLCGATPEYKGPICPQNTANSFLYIDGRPITHGVLVHHEKVWISIPVLAKAIGYAYQINSETGIADLFNGATVSPSAYAKLFESSPKAASKSDSKSKEKKEKPDENEIPVAVQNLSQNQDPNTYEVRVFFDVKNTSDHDAKGVSATLAYMDGDGKPILTRPFSIGTLAPGAVVHENDYWINTTRIYMIKADVQLDWEGKKKKVN